MSQGREPNTNDVYGRDDIGCLAQQVEWLAQKMETNPFGERGQNEEMRLIENLDVQRQDAGSRIDNTENF